MVGGGDSDDAVIATSYHHAVHIDSIDRYSNCFYCKLSNNRSIVSTKFSVNMNPNSSNDFSPAFG